MDGEIKVTRQMSEAGADHLQRLICQRCTPQEIVTSIYRVMERARHCETETEYAIKAETDDPYPWA